MNPAKPNTSTQSGIHKLFHAPPGETKQNISAHAKAQEAWGTKLHNDQETLRSAGEVEGLLNKSKEESQEEGEEQMARRRRGGEGTTQEDIRRNDKQREYAYGSDALGVAPPHDNEAQQFKDGQHPRPFKDGWEKLNAKAREAKIEAQRLAGSREVGERDLQELEMDDQERKKIDEKAFGSRSGRQDDEITELTKTKKGL